MTDRSVREIAGDTFIGRRTPKGIVVRRMHKGEAAAQWFVSNRTGEVFHMPFGGGRFEPVISEREAEMVTFFANRTPE